MEKNGEISIRGHDAIQLITGITESAGSFDAASKSLQEPLSRLSRKSPDTRIKIVVGPDNNCRRKCSKNGITCDPESPDLVDLDEHACEILEKRFGKTITLRGLTSLTAGEIAQIQQEYFQTPGDIE